MGYLRGCLLPLGHRGEQPARQVPLIPFTTTAKQSHYHCKAVPENTHNLGQAWPVCLFVNCVSPATDVKRCTPRRDDTAWHGHRDDCASHGPSTQALPRVVCHGAVHLRAVNALAGRVTWLCSRKATRPAKASGRMTRGFANQISQHCKCTHHPSHRRCHWLCASRWEAREVLGIGRCWHTVDWSVQVADCAGQCLRGVPQKKVCVSEINMQSSLQPRAAILPMHAMHASSSEPDCMHAAVCRRQPTEPATHPQPICRLAPDGCADACSATWCS